MKKMRLLLMLFMVGALVMSSGCSRRKSSKRQPTIKYPYALKTVFRSPPAIVISQTDLVLANHRVFYPDGMQSKRVTGVDGYFEFRTALGNDYRVKVQGLSHTETNFTIEYQRPLDKDIAEIIRSSVESKLFADR